MKSASILVRTILSAAVLAATAGSVLPVVADTPAAPDVAALTQAVTQAPDPSAAVQAYARATAVAPSDLSVEQAYLHRMVSFGLPEMADTQAADLTLRSPGDGEAWAVAAYMIAKKNQGGPGTAWALMDADLAVTAAPDDPFVARTAAQLVAWYDVRADKTQITAAAQKAVETIRHTLAGNAAYADAYARASADYLKMADAAAPPTPPAQPSPETVQAAPYPYYYDVPDLVYAPYPEPYAIAPYDAYWYPDVWAGANWWFPGFFVGGIVIGDDFRRHRDFDHDRDDRVRRFDGDRDDWVRDPVRSGSITTNTPRVSVTSSGRSLTPASGGSLPRVTSSGATSPRITSATGTVPSPRVTVAPAPAATWTFPERSGSGSISMPRPVTSVPRISGSIGTPRVVSPSVPSRSLMSAGPRLSAPSMGGGIMRSSGGGGGAIRTGGGGGSIRAGGGGGGFGGGRR